LPLAQQATLETRDAKHEPRSLAEQRTSWLGDAAAVLGSSQAVASMVRTALAPPAEATAIADARWVSQTASHIMAAMEQSRSTWPMWHVRAEAHRQVRTIELPAEHAAALVDLLVDEVLDRRSVALAAPHDGVEETEVLRRVDGSSIYTVAGADLYTSQRILDAEARLVGAAERRGGASAEPRAVDLAVLELAANGTALDAGQASLVRQMCTSGARLQLAIAPAGAGNDRHARPDRPPSLVSPVAQLGDRWSRGIDPTSTLDPYSAGLRKRVLPALGHLPVSMMSAGLIDRAIDQWEAAYGRSTVKNTIAALVLVLDEAVRDGLLMRNPAKDRARRRIVGRSAMPMAAPESPRDFALPDVSTLSRLVEEAMRRGGHQSLG
jgi:hypothetical protein